jgi:hypothetical protein
MSEVNGTQWMLGEAKRMLRDRATPDDVRKFANAVLELIAQCRIAVDSRDEAIAERDRMRERLQALIDEFDQGELVFSNPERSHLWAPKEFIPRPTECARLVRRQELGQ